MFLLIRSVSQSQGSSSGGGGGGNFYFELPQAELLHISIQRLPLGLFGFAQDDGPLIFNGLSLSIPSGSSCALVGRTGCGKSSFLSALVRLYPLCGGKLYLHGILTDFDEATTQLLWLLIPT